MINIKRISTEDKILDQMQQNTETVFNQIVGREIIDGRLLKNINLTVGIDNPISHKLDRDLMGYIIVKNNTNCTIWESTTNSKTLTLRCSASTVISLGVF
jgi:hypothetical protein